MITYRTEKRTTTERGGAVPFLTVNLFDGYPVLSAISTRMGGVSTGHCATMNMSAFRGDDMAHVLENREIFARACGYDNARLVMSDQIHETRIRRVTVEDAGKGVVERGVDGLMTDVCNLPLMTFYADCVPLMFYDPVKHVIAMSHSGWKGTVAKIGAITVKALQEAYGSRPEDILAAIGPSICQKCYEVDEPVKLRFFESFGEDSEAFFAPSVKEKHYLLDLSGACSYTLRKAGVKPEHIAMPDLCTCCNPEYLFSHRATGGKRGNMSVVLQLKNRVEGT